MEEKITAWVAREQDGTLILYVGGMPFKGTNFWKLYDPDGIGMQYLNKESFPQVKWEDKEPTKVELTIKIKE